MLRVKNTFIDVSDSHPASQRSRSLSHPRTARADSDGLPALDTTAPALRGRSRTARPINADDSSSTTFGAEGLEDLRDIFNKFSSADPNVATLPRDMGADPAADTIDATLRDDASGSHCQVTANKMTRHQLKTSNKNEKYITITARL